MPAASRRSFLNIPATFASINWEMRAVMGDHGPTVLVCAHMDEVGMIVTGIEDNGFLRIWQMGGIDRAFCRGAR